MFSELSGNVYAMWQQTVFCPEQVVLYSIFVSDDKNPRGFLTKYTGFQSLHVLVYFTVQIVAQTFMLVCLRMSCQREPDLSEVVTGPADI